MEAYLLFDLLKKQIPTRKLYLRICEGMEVLDENVYKFARRLSLNLFLVQMYLQSQIDEPKSR